MRPDELLAELRRRGYRPTAAGEKLKLRGPGPPPADLEREIVSGRDGVMELLRSECELPESDPDLLPAIRAMLSQYPQMIEFPPDYIALNLTIFGEYTNEPPIADVEAALQALDVERGAA